MIGNPGTGKSHLAVGLLRQFHSAKFISQSELLYQLRRTYKSQDAPDPVEKCKRTCCLVLDDVGVSAGGKDEWPMIHHILDFRYGHSLPTIITGNINIDEFKELVGTRMVDRLFEATHEVIVTGGESLRKETNTTGTRINSSLMNCNYPIPDEKRELTLNQRLAIKLEFERSVKAKVVRLDELNDALRHPQDIAQRPEFVEERNRLKTALPALMAELEKASSEYTKYALLDAQQ